MSDEPANARRSLGDPSTNRASLAIALVVSAVAAVAADLLATARYGIGLTPDSLVYIDGARGIAHGHQYVANGVPISDFPPGYSAVLSIGDRMGLNLFDASRVLSVVAIVVTVLLGHVLVRRHVRSAAIVVVTTVVIGCSAVLLEVYQRALSEHLFIPVVLAFVLIAEDFMKHEDLTRAAGLVALTWAAFYLRYIGIVFVGVSALVVLVARWRRDRVAAFVWAGAVAIAGFAAPALWVIRNRRAHVPVFGHRAATSATPVKNAARVTNEISTWLASDRAPVAIRVAAFVVVVGAVCFFALQLIRQRAGFPPDSGSMFVLGLVVVVYVGYLVASASLVAFAAIDTRLMSPVFVPIVVITAWLYEFAGRHLSGAAARRALAAGVLPLIIVNLGWFATVTAQSATRGAGGYATDRYHDSELLQVAKKLDYSVPTFSNDAPAIELFVGKPVTASVARTHFASDQQSGRLPGFVRMVRCTGRIQLVWFLPNPRSYLYTPSQLSRDLDLRARVRVSDGVVYDVTARDASRAGCPSA